MKTPKTEALAQRPKKALVKVGYACNNNCVFCHAADWRLRDEAGASVEAKIARAAELGCQMVVLSGGEPTIRPELLQWSREARRHNLGLGLVTNGRMLAYPSLVRRLLERNLVYVHLALHGPTAEVHDPLVQSRGFEQSLAALQNLAGRGLELTVSCVVTCGNVDRLRELVELMLPFADLRLKFSMVEAKGAALRRFDAVVPPLSLVARRVGDAIGHGLARSTGLRLAHEGIPLCLLPDLEGMGCDLRSEGFVVMSEAHEADFCPVDTANKVLPSSCAGCRLRGACPGLFREYFARRGDLGLRPVAVSC